MTKSDKHREGSNSTKKSKKSPVAGKMNKRKAKELNKNKSPSKKISKKPPKGKKLFNREIEVYTSIKITKENDKNSKTEISKRSKPKSKKDSSKNSDKKTPVAKVIIRKRPGETPKELK